MIDSLQKKYREVIKINDPHKKEQVKNQIKLSNNILLHKLEKAIK
jgi:hypothetical protein